MPLVHQRDYKSIMAVVDAEISDFVGEVTTKFAQILFRVGTQLEVIYVYGGDATPVKNELYDGMLEMIRAVSGAKASISILYLDSWYSRYMNREGLFILAKNAATEAAKA